MDSDAFHNIGAEGVERFPAVVRVGFGGEGANLYAGIGGANLVGEVVYDGGGGGWKVDWEANGEFGLYTKGEAKMIGVFLTLHAGVHDRGVLSGALHEVADAMNVNHSYTVSISA